MSQLDEYRKRARLRYENDVMKREKEEREIEEKLKEEERIRLEEIKRKIDEENSKNNKALTILLEIEEHVDSLQLDNSLDNVLCEIILIESLILINIEFIKEMKKMSDLQDTIMNLVNILNMIHENNNNTKDLLILKNISEKIKNIFDLIGLDIKIELMDTDNDENFAKDFEDKLKLIDIQNDEAFAKEFHKKINKITKIKD